MTCDQYQELIPEYLDKSLSSDNEQDLKRHLDSCDSCRKELRMAEALAGAVHALPRHQPSAETVLKVSEMIHQSAPAPHRQGDYGPVLDVDDLANYLRVDKAVIEIYLDELPHFELGGKLLFRRKSVDEWIEARERAAAFQVSDAFMEGPVVPNP